MTAKPLGKNKIPVPASFEIKSAQLSMVALLLKSGDLSTVAKELLHQFGPDSDSAGFFEHDPVVMDLSVLERDAPYEDPQSLLQAARACQLAPIAVRGAPSHWQESLAQLGLVEVPLEPVRAKAQTPAQHQSAQVVEVVREVPGPTTMVVDKPLRSGQKVYARGADLIVLAMVNQGAEVVADGNIHVYAPLRGKAMAGARGNTDARIFSICLEPELISIAGVYRTSETPLPKDIAGKPAQVRLSNDGQDKLLIEPLKT